jgi:hypothetical protein
MLGHPTKAFHADLTCPCYRSVVHPFFMARTPSSPPAAPAAPLMPQVLQPAAVQPVAPPPQIMQQHNTASLLERLVAAAPFFGDLVKDSKNDYLKSQYMSLPALLKAVKPPLLEQGVTIYSQLERYGDGYWVVRTTLSTIDGSEELFSDFPVPDITSLQKIGGAVTYGVRYNILALLAACPENDDDGNSVATPAPTFAHALPGFPGGVQVPAAWPAPGQQVQAPQMVYAPAPMPAPMPPAIAYPTQPLPVLPQ